MPAAISPSTAVRGCRCRRRVGLVARSRAATQWSGVADTRHRARPRPHPRIVARAATGGPRARSALGAGPGWRGRPCRSRVTRLVPSVGGSSTRRGQATTNSMGLRSSPRLNPPARSAEAPPSAAGAWSSTAAHARCVHVRGPVWSTYTPGSTRAYRRRRIIRSTSSSLPPCPRPAVARSRRLADASRLPSSCADDGRSDERPPAEKATPVDNRSNRPTCAFFRHLVRKTGRLDSCSGLLGGELQPPVLADDVGAEPVLRQLVEQVERPLGRCGLRRRGWRW